MKTSKNNGPLCGILLFCFVWPFLLSAQYGLPTLDVEAQMTISNDLVIIPEADYGKQCYFLPDRLSLKINQDGQPMFSLLRFAGKESSGTLLNAHFTLEPASARSYEIQELLSSKSDDLFYAGSYPFHRHEKFHGRFENIDLIIEVVEGAQREEIWRHKAALTTNALVIAAKVPDSIAASLWEILSEGGTRKIEFKVDLALKTLDYPDGLKLSYNPSQLKAYLLDTPDSTQVSQEDFIGRMNLLLEAEEPSIVELSGNTEGYSKEELNKMIRGKIAAQLFENEQGEVMISNSRHSSTKKVRRRVYVNGKLVEDESTTNEDSTTDNTEGNGPMKFKQEELLSNAIVQYSLGRKSIETRTYPLRFSLSDFYGQHADYFRSN